MDQSDRAGLDAVLRGVLPLRAVSTPDAHQRLFGALDPQEIQTITSRLESHRVLAGDHRAVSPHVRALGLDSLGRACLTTRMTRARGRETVTPGSVGARGCDFPGPPDHTGSSPVERPVIVSPFGGGH